MECAHKFLPLYAHQFINYAVYGSIWYDGEVFRIYDGVDWLRREEVTDDKLRTLLDFSEGITDGLV